MNESSELVDAGALNPVLDLDIAEGEGDAAVSSESGTAGETASAAEVFEHLARIRSGISEGVITPW
jgi:hypothetical protein